MHQLRMIIITCMSVVLGCIPALTQEHPPTDSGHAGHNHSFANAEKWSAEFDDPARDQWQRPHEIITALSLRPTDLEADIGAGTGYLSVRLARHLTAGTVYVVDAEKDMVQHLTERAKASGIANLHPILARFPPGFTGWGSEGDAHFGRPDQSRDDRRWISTSEYLRSPALSELLGLSEGLRLLAERR